MPAPLPLIIALPAMLVKRGRRRRHKRAFNVAHGLLMVELAAAPFAHSGAPAGLPRPGRLPRRSPR